MNRWLHGPSLSPRGGSAAAVSAMPDDRADGGTVFAQREVNLHAFQDATPPAPRGLFRWMLQRRPTPVDTRSLRGPCVPLEVCKIVAFPHPSIRQFRKLGNSQAALHDVYTACFVWLLKWEITESEGQFDRMPTRNYGNLATAKLIRPTP